MRTGKPIPKDSMFLALISLMKEKEFQYISISDITRRANVSRMTYYRTYSSKEDILVQYFTALARSMVRGANDETDAALAQFFGYFLAEPELISLFESVALNRILTESFAPLTRFIFENSYPTAEGKPEYPYMVAYQAQGLFSIVRTCIAAGAKESPQELAQLTLRIL